MREKKIKEQIDNYKYELELKDKDIKLIAGVDEVGRGPLIGPVVAAAVILPKNYKLEGLTDSKKISEKKRETFYHILMEEALAIGVYCMAISAVELLVSVFRWITGCSTVISLFVWM